MNPKRRRTLVRPQRPGTIGLGNKTRIRFGSSTIITIGGHGKKTFTAKTAGKIPTGGGKSIRYPPGTLIGISPAVKPKTTKAQAEPPPTKKITRTTTATTKKTTQTSKAKKETTAKKNQEGGRKMPRKPTAKKTVKKKKTQKKRPVQQALIPIRGDNIRMKIDPTKVDVQRSAPEVRIQKPKKPKVKYY